ncbi:MAG: TAXI family TRAP transporter solute-binding subunit [Candidatus Competibacteraceae bacterium]|jgi:TRAP transporter TAXI family solute receptor|nr:TAXI family TRAP transporter solute-binding subunit [Candidatus Competibacteraceae bacterium]
MCSSSQLLGIFIATVLTVLSGTAYAEQEQDIDNTRVLTIGTGSLTGVYYPLGGAVCRLVNRERERHGIRCLADSTEGSVSNLNAIRAGEMDMAVVQSDWQYHAYHGSSQFEAQGPDQDLRAVFSLHSEPFTVVARADSGITLFDDLKDKRINVGNPGSGQRATLEVVLEAMGWTLNEFAQVLELSAAEQAQALCDNTVDAIIFTVGHPNRSILEATTACDSVLVPVTGPAIDELVQSRTYYTHATIPGGLYRGNVEEIPTFGVKATLVTSTRIPEETVYQVVKAVFDNFDEFRSLHPALADLDKQIMIQEGNSAPLHPSTGRYFLETGIIDAPAPE